MKNDQNKDEIPPDVLDSIFDIMNKCTKLSERNAPLMGKVLDFLEDGNSYLKVYYYLSKLYNSLVGNI